MGLSLRNLGKKITDVLGEGVDAIIPGNQSFLHQTSPVAQTIHNVSQGAQNVVNQGVHVAQQLPGQVVQAARPIVNPVVATASHVLPEALDVAKRVQDVAAYVNPATQPIMLARAALDKVAPSVSHLYATPSEVTTRIAQGIPQAGARLANTVMGTETTPTGGFQKTLLGDAPVGQFKDYTQQNIGFKTGNNLADTAIGAGLSALDVGVPGAPRVITPALKAASRATSIASKPVVKLAAKGIQAYKDNPLLNEAGYIGQARDSGRFAAGKNIHPEDLATITDFIDYTRGAYKPTPQAAQQLELDAARIAEHYNIPGAKNTAGLANNFDKRIQTTPGLLDKIKAPLQNQTGAVGADVTKPVVKFKDNGRVPLEVTNKNTFRGELQTALVDKEAPIINYLKNVEKQTGQKGLVDQFYYDSGLQRRSNAIANQKVQSSPDLQNALKGLTGKSKQEFDAYAAARNELSNAKRGLPTSRPVEDLKRTVTGLAPKHGQRFESLNRFYQTQAKAQLDAGLIDEPTYKQFISNPDYSRIQRDMTDLANPNGAGNSYSLGSTLARQKRTGSKRAIQPADATVFNYAQQTQKEIQRNQTASNLIDVLESQGHARKLKPSEAARTNTLKRIVNGKTEVYEVPRDIKEIADNITPFQLGALGRVVSAPQRLLRAGATGLSAPFTAANYVKDQVSSGVFSKSISATHAPQNIASGIYQATKDFGIGSDDALWQKFTQHLGDTTQYDFIRNAKNSKQLSREVRLGQGGRAINRGLHPIRTLEDLNQITEKATRFQNFKGIYNKALKETGSEAEATKQATLAAWQNSVDFSRMGNVSQALNLLIPYFNAGIQGTRTLTRAAKGAPIGFTAKTISLLGMPLMGVTLWNTSDPERKKVYDNISDYEKQNNIVVVLPGAHQQEDGSYTGVIKMPLQQGLSNLVQPIRVGVENYADQAPAEVGKMAQQFLGAFSGPINTSSPQAAVAGLIPQVAKPSVQQAANKDFFTGKEIVPDYVNKATDAQGNPVPENKKAFGYTSGSARLVGNALGVSPIRVEKFVKDTSGKVGQYTQNAVDTALASQGVIPKEQIGGVSIADDFARRFSQAQGKENFQKSAGAKYFDDVKTATQGLNGNEQAAYNALHPSKTNFLGEVMLDENKRVTAYTKAGAYLQHPKVFTADKKLDQLQRDKGAPGNPLFDLPPDEVNKILLKATLPPGATDPELSNLYKEPWYQDYSNARSKYFDQVSESLKKEGKTLPKSANPYPETPPGLQKVMDGYSALPKGTGARSAWITANPGLFKQMTDQWGAVDAWDNKERQSIGLSPIDKTADTSSSSYGYKKSAPDTNPYKYAVSINAGGKIAKSTVKARKLNTPKSAKKVASRPKVSIRKSNV